MRRETLKALGGSRDTIMAEVRRRSSINVSVLQAVRDAANAKDNANIYEDE